MKRLTAVFAALILAGSAFAAAAVGGAAVAGGTASFAGRPMIAASTPSPGVPTISENWSGYAATSSKKFTYAHSRFVQPAVTCTGAKNRWTSNWVGLDGFNDGTVEQDGTFAHCGGKGNLTPKYEAWFEMFPADSVSVFKVRPGDVIDTAVNYKDGQFVLTVADLTSGKSATNSATCAQCTRSSAEWIIERPALCNDTGTNCFLTALADFDTATMTQSKAKVAGGHTKSVAAFTNYPIFMIDPLKRGFISLDTVSDVTGSSFTATWDRSGKTVPITF